MSLNFKLEIPRSVAPLSPPVETSLLDFLPFWFCIEKNKTKRKVSYWVRDFSDVYNKYLNKNILQEEILSMLYMKQKNRNVFFGELFCINCKFYINGRFPTCGSQPSVGLWRYCRWRHSQYLSIFNKISIHLSKFLIVISFKTDWTHTHTHKIL